MTEVILHNYPLSHYSEKIRRILAYKGVPWRSVEQPNLMPKPELTPLTGGYRRLPVLQLGADIYCDTSCITRRLERLQPEPSCIPAGQAAMVALIEEWGDHRFAPQITRPVMVDLIPALSPALLADRAAMTPLLAKEAILRDAPHALAQALLGLDLLDSHLRERRFLLGDAFRLADAACFFPVWFLGKSARLSGEVGKRPSLAAWFERIESFGPGKVTPMTAAEALTIARDSKPEDPPASREVAADFAPGAAVAIAADDYGPERTHGTVVRATADEITIRREDAALGEIAVHFPRSGYRITRC